MTNYTEKQMDLFSVDPEWALAHCVGSDFIMGRGIATEFKKRYGNVDWLLKNSKGIGTALLLNKSQFDLDRNIFYLVTKNRSKYDKPSYDDIEKSIIDMFQQATDLNITMIAMPKIGCGLDGKKWELVSEIIKKHQPPNISVFIAKF